MDLQNMKVRGWTVETAQMKHTARKYSMATVAQSWLRKHAAIAGVDDYQGVLTSVRDDPETYDTLPEVTREFCDTASSVGVWTAVCACVRPYIGVDEWLSLDEGAVNELSAAVEQLNPHWFVAPDQEKKIEELQPTSTSE